MPTVSEIYQYLNTILPTSLSCDWDNDGLMVCPNPNKEVRTILFALDITPAVVNFAKSVDAELIISHHPLIFRGIKRMDGSDGTSRKVMDLIQNHIAAMSFHTRLDAADGGINDILADRFGLCNIEKFGAEGDDSARIGTLPEPMKFEDFCDLVKIKLDAPNVCGAKGNDMVSRLAILGGSGKDYISAAQNMGADTFLTGEVNYNYLLDAAENGLSVVTAGHYHTEAPFFMYFIKALSEKFGKFCFVNFPKGCEFYYG
ncbi:MAG: Nif3-like dinuclear metal center hexameric protein [Clostridia bacterium]|nr:Nif3-like dinuclear metal center hexameric protein [Clostridia bacterium]